jgi:hypothetical protein
MQPEAPQAPLATALAALRRLLAPAGLDRLGVARVGDFNAAMEPRWRLPDLGAPDHAAVVIGHGRAVWAPFRAAFAASAQLQADPNPFDRWTAARVSEAVAAALPRALPRDLRHVWEGPPRMVAMQALAVHAGLGVRGPAGLVVDPALGPWQAFRAALVIALPAPPRHLASAAGAPCDTCASRPCVPAHEAALSAAQAPAASGCGPSLGPAWARWLAVRDACPVGREARYGERQIVYHYAHDRRALREEG